MKVRHIKANKCEELRYKIKTLLVEIQRILIGFVTKQARIPISHQLCRKYVITNLLSLIAENMFVK